MELLFLSVKDNIAGARGWIEIVKTENVGSIISPAALKLIKDGSMAAFSQYQDFWLDILQQSENALQDGVMQSEYFAKVDSEVALICASLEAIVKKLFEFNTIRARLEADIVGKLGAKTCCTAGGDGEDLGVNTQWKEAFGTYKKTLYEIYIDSIGQYCFDLTKLVLNYIQDLVRLGSVLGHPQNKATQAELYSKKRKHCASWI